MNKLRRGDAVTFSVTTKYRAVINNVSVDGKRAYCMFGSGSGMFPVKILKKQRKKISVEEQRSLAEMGAYEFR